jgi:hypothetical protein
LNTNIRIADERLSVLRVSSIWSINLYNVTLSRLAISRSPAQNSFSSDTLVLRPWRRIERFVIPDPAVKEGDLTSLSFNRIACVFLLLLFFGEKLANSLSFGFVGRRI